jgi:hypothetical protein
LPLFPLPLIEEFLVLLRGDELKTVEAHFLEFEFKYLSTMLLEVFMLV